MGKTDSTRDKDVSGIQGSAPVVHNRPKQGWESPVYSQSRLSSLDPDHLKGTRCIGLFPEVPYTKHYKILKTQVHQRLMTSGWNTIMVTSPRPGDGKTVTAINLSFAFAQDFSHTVMLIDCDLKQQQVHEYLGIPSERGIADYLIDDVPLKDLIIWPKVDKFTFISGGVPLDNRTELLNSPKMQSLVVEIKKRYDDRIIIFDTPPLLDEPDAMAFLPQIECVLLVVEAGKTLRKDIEKALRLIPKEKFLGFVLNRQVPEGRKPGRNPLSSFMEMFRKEKPSGQSR
jgi:non-specific protein-tyrosine kinase